MSRKFIIRNLALGKLSPTDQIIKDKLEIINDDMGGDKTHFLKTLNTDKDNMTQFQWNYFGRKIINLEIIQEGLLFQNKNIAERAVQFASREYQEYCARDTVIIATDASKTDNKSAIAAINITEDKRYSALINYNNSIFTPGAMALIKAIECFVIENKQYLVLSNSKSVISALSNVNRKSQTVIL